MSVERDRIIEEIADKIETAFRERNLTSGIWERELAEIALRVVEHPYRGSENYSGICTCGQNGYPENSELSNHPHRKDCPQYTGRYDE